MALTQLKTSGIADDAVTEDKIANAINTARAANTAKDLTALSAANLTSGTIPDARFPATLPAASGANLTNVAVKPNIIINGAMLVAQRGTSSTTSGYGTVDRFRMNYGGTDEAPTQAQVDVASDSTPYSLGFRKAFRVTNGNQTSGAGAGDTVQIQHRIEAQNMANSGWNYTSTSSFLTFSFWVKSSVAQNFYGYILTADGTPQNYSFETGSLSANTWTKVTKTILGNSNLQFDNNVGVGLKIHITPFLGTDFTNSSVSLNSWYEYSSGIRTPDQTTTWYTTNDATFEITGVQLEVGSTASAFAHESYADTLAKCQRYLYILDMGVNGNNHFLLLARFSHNNGVGYGDVQFPTTMRDNPSFSYLGTAITQSGYAGNPALYASTPDMATLYGSTAIVAGGISYLRRGTDSSDILKLVFSAEL